MWTASVMCTSARARACVRACTRVCVYVRVCAHAPEIQLLSSLLLLSIVKLALP